MKCVHHHILAHRGEDDDLSFAARVSQSIGELSDAGRTVLLNLPLRSHVGRAFVADWKRFHRCAQHAADTDIVAQLAATFVRQCCLHLFA